jgi:hypothetical protein
LVTDEKGPVPLIDLRRSSNEEPLADG